MNHWRKEYGSVVMREREQKWLMEGGGREHLGEKRASGLQHLVLAALRTNYPASTHLTWTDHVKILICLALWENMGNTHFHPALYCESVKSKDTKNLGGSYQNLHVS